MVGSMVSCWWDSVDQETAVEFSWEEMRGSYNCESGCGVGKLYIIMCGFSCEGWVVVDVDCMDIGVGALEVYRY